MSVISRLKTWGSELLKSSDLNAEFNNITNTLNNIDSGSVAWANCNSTNSTQTTSTITTATITKLVHGLMKYRRPVLQYNSATVVNIETGLTGTAGQVQIMFSDGSVRTDSTAGRIQCNLGQVASLTGTAQSGLRTGTVAANTWYAVYTVKSQVNTTDIVAVADVVLPIQANYATLNSNFGTDAWQYIGLVRNGDNSGSTTAILGFTQCGNKTVFRNKCVTQANYGPGTLLATDASNTALAYTYSAGTGAANIPNNVAFVSYLVTASSTGADYKVTAQGDTANYLLRLPNTVGTPTCIIKDVPAVVGLAVASTSATTHDIVLYGFVDGALGVGSNPLL